MSSPSFLDGITQTFTNNQFLDKIMNSGPGEIPYVTFGMVGVSVAALLYVTLTDSAESIGESFKNITAFNPLTSKEDSTTQEEEQREESINQQQEEEQQKEESAK